MSTSVTTTTTAASDSTAKTSLNVSSLGKDDFLKLLLAELKNQDPLNPASNTEFVAQLAQFSSLEQMTQMNENLGKSIENSTGTAETINSAMMVSYIGKNVEAETADFSFDGTDGVNLRFDLENSAVSGKLEIVDSSGDVIRTIKLGVMNSGENKITWDGMTSGGVYADTGQYSFKVTAEDISGEDVQYKPLSLGSVEGIIYKDGKSYLYIGGALVPFDKVRSISNG